MEVVEQGYEFIQVPEYPLTTIEQVGRTCYKSEDKITDDSAGEFVRRLRDRGHHAMIEFGVVMVRITTTRSCANAIVRHRHGSFAQESTQYCNYGGKEIEFVKPVWLPDLEVGIYHSPTRRYGSGVYEWLCAMLNGEGSYKRMINDLKFPPQWAREVLPHSLKTELCVMANFREWRHIFTLRTSKADQGQTQALFKKMLVDFREQFPVLFDDIAHD